MHSATKVHVRVFHFVVVSGNHVIGVESYLVLDESDAALIRSFAYIEN